MEKQTYVDFLHLCLGLLTSSQLLFFDSWKIKENAHKAGTNDQTSVEAKLDSCLSWHNDR